MPNTNLRLNLDFHGCVSTKRTIANVNCTSAVTVAVANMKYLLCVLVWVAKGNFPERGSGSGNYRRRNSHIASAPVASFSQRV